MTYVFLFHSSNQDQDCYQKGCIGVVQTDKDWAGRPEGMLFVRLIEANNVPRMDWFRLIRSDPFIV